jgi:NADH-quinone oxidoreductase subunit N
MNLEAVRLAAASNQWAAIFPEIALGGLALLLLVLELALPKSAHRHIPAVALAGQAGVLAWLGCNFLPASVGTETFNHLLRHSNEGQVMRVFFVLSSLLVTVLGMISLPKRQVPRVEFHHIVLVITAAMMLLAQSNHFVMLFVALETVTVGFYILVGYFRTSPLSLEAGLKYLVMGALSSGLLLFGIALLYGVAGNPALPGHSAEPMNFAALRFFLATGDNAHHFLAATGVVLVLAGVAFKIGAFPFQIWIPDVYQGAPTPVTAFLAVGSKAAGFAVLLNVVQVFAPCAWLLVPVFTAMTAATILFGNFAALTQHNVKRLIGLSGVAHAGFLLLGVLAAAWEPMAMGAVYFYLIAYLLASFAVFGVMAHVGGADDADQELGHYAGLARQNPFLATVLAVGLGSLAGIPPLAGFMGKLFIFVAAFRAELYGLLAVAIVGVVVSIYYYFGWIKAAFFEPPAAPAEDAPAGRTHAASVGLLARVVLTVLAVATVALGFYQGPLGAWVVSR